MQQKTQAAIAYDVAVDKGSLKGQVVETEGTRYSVALSGPVDERWERAFNLVLLDSTGFSRFRLSLAEKRITFRARAGDGAARVILLLEWLDRLVEEVNRSASYWGRSA